MLETDCRPTRFKGRLWAAALLVSIFHGQAAAADLVEAILSDRHTLFFIVLNLGLTCYFVFFRFNRFAVAHGPEILTTFGIFGCFIGIALALLNFDATKVSASVPQLLEGVKTAFWASVTGVGGALAIRARHALQRTPIRQSEGAPKSASLDDLVAATQALQRSLSGNEDGSLLSQMKLMRQEQNDQLRELNTSFKTFAEKMKEDGSRALIDALREVIADFNAKINEQFGENFKQLNAAVEKLVRWQELYREELDKLQTVQRQSAEDMRTAAAAFTQSAKQAEPFTQSAADLKRLLEGLVNQYAVLQESQRALTQLLGEMRTVTPQFAQKITEMTDQLKGGLSLVQSEVSSAVKSLSSQVQGSQAEMKSLLVDSIKKSNEESNKALTSGVETLQKGVQSLDKALQIELERSLSTLGRQLASLSEKFVADYTPLTERLREVVRIAGNPRNM